MIPNSWQQILEQIQRITPDAVIAGGALRDLDNGVDVKDLDIFIQARSNTEAHYLIAHLERIGIKIVCDTCKNYPEDKNLEVVLVAYTEEAVEGTPVQLIFTNWDIHNLVDRFDYGICQIAYDGKEYRVHPNYSEDKLKKQFKLRRTRRNDLEMRASVLRYARLLEKYPEWDWQPFTEEIFV